MSESTDVRVARVDSWANSDLASKNYADGPHLGLKSASAYAFLRFTLPRDFKPTQDRSVTVESATLRVYTKGSWGVTPTLTVKRVSESWGPQKLTWNNKPAVTGSGATESHSSAADGDVFEVDVTTLMQTVANGADWYGFRVETSNGALKYLYSSNSPLEDFRPTLELTWSEAPQQPTRLSPAGGRSVSIAKPVVSCEFDDRAGSTAMQAIQVQVDAAADDVSPDFDSGTVTATVPELDLSTTAYAGLTAGTSTQWRVRVQDASGLWSPWSDWAEFSRDNKGTLTIDNPAASPNDFVEEWTPEFAWTLTGETQVAYQAIVTAADDLTTYLWDSGRTKGPADTVTPPKGVLVDDETFTLIIRIWDSSDREHTPGDPVWTQATREFTVEESATPTPVATLSTAQVDDGPYIDLDFTRATAPDSFTVRRNTAGNGYKTIDSDLDPSDLFVSGTSYQYIDRDAPANRQHVYKVIAVVNHQASTTNPTATITNSTSGIWLFDHDLEIEVFVNNGDQSSFDAVEQSTWFAPLGAGRQTLITQGMQGLSGTIVGTLTATAGRTAEAWTDRMNRIKGRAGKRVRLTLGNDSIPVVLSNVVIAPLEDSETEKALSFDFQQVGDLPFRYRG